MAVSTRPCQITDLVLLCAGFGGGSGGEERFSKEPIWVSKGYRVRTVASNRQPGA